MDLAISSSRYWLRGLGEKLLELADMQVQPEMKNLPRDLLSEQFRDSIHQLCQDASLPDVLSEGMVEAGLR